MASRPALRQVLLAASVAYAMFLSACLAARLALPVVATPAAGAAIARGCYRAQGTLPALCQGFAGADVAAALLNLPVFLALGPIGALFELLALTEAASVAALGRAALLLGGVLVLWAPIVYIVVRARGATRSP